MDRDEMIFENEQESVDTEAFEEVIVKKPRRWPTVVITAVITLFVAVALTTVLFFSTFGDALSLAARYKKFYEIETLIQGNFIGDIDAQSIFDGAAAGMIDGLGDQWSGDMSAEEVHQYAENLTNSYVGVGISVTKPENEYIYVEDVVPDSGAYAAGIMPGDYITAVNGTDIKLMVLDDVTELIKGKEGTTVKLTVSRDNNIFDVTVERRRIEEASIEYQMIDDVGYVKVINFYDNTALNFKAAVEDLIANGAKGLVFDVRFNGGGYLKELYEMLNYLLPEGVVFRTEDKAGNEFTQESDASCVEMPIAVLINDRSVSAAEYFAAVISEYNWGTIVGMPTLGKGYSQNLFYLSDGSAVNLSTRKYFTPNGVCLAGVGLAPDVEVEITYEEYLGIYYGTVEMKDDIQLMTAVDIVKK